LVKDQFEIEQTCTVKVVQLLCITPDTDKLTGAVNNMVQLVSDQLQQLVVWWFTQNTQIKQPGSSTETSKECSGY